jgi:hypothetical protein
MPDFAQKTKSQQASASAAAAVPERAEPVQLSDVQALLHLQRTIGNGATRLLMQSEGDAHESNDQDDAFERNADAVAERVMRMPEPSRQRTGSPETARIRADDVGGIAAPSSARDVLRSPGQPLDPATRAFMEPRFGYDLSRVRVHADGEAARSARDLNARAYAAGHAIVFGAGQFAPGTGEGRRLLAHELAHVVQQRGSGESNVRRAAIAPSAERIARQANPGPAPPKNAGKMLTDWLLPAPKPASSPKPPETHTSDRARKTRVRVAVTGHASPRWSGARSNRQADELNLRLSHQRENAVRERVEDLLREALPDEQLVFEHVKPAAADADPFDLRASVDVESSAVGSQQTLGEAGKAGRRANDPSMRRVDLSVDLSSAIDTIQDTRIHEKRRVSGATRKWAIKMGMAMQAEEGVGGGMFNFMLKNLKTSQEVEGWAEFGLGGVGASVPIPTIDMGDYESFTTKADAVFSDFDYKRFTIGSFGFNALLFGYEWSSMAILGLPGGDVSDIDIGGFVMGGAGVDLGSGKFGMMWLKSTPDTYVADVVRDQRKAYTSRMTDTKRLRVLFETGDATISPDQDEILQAFVESAVANYQRGGVYSP